MSAVEKLKVAAAKLDPDEQYKLFRWWVGTDVFRERQLAALKRGVALGLQQLDDGHYRTYNGTNVMRLAEEVGRTGRECLKSWSA